jgi:hypothetical protein
MVNQKLEGDRLHTTSPVGACHTLAGAFATMANNVVFVPMVVVKHCCSCGGVLIQGDVGIFFPSWRRECGCAFYTSYSTTMVINYIPFTAVHFAAL